MRCIILYSLFNIIKCKKKIFNVHTHNYFFLQIILINAFCVYFFIILCEDLCKNIRKIFINISEASVYLYIYILRIILSCHIRIWPNGVLRVNYRLKMHATQNIIRTHFIRWYMNTLQWLLFVNIIYISVLCISRLDWDK